MEKADADDLLSRIEELRRKYSVWSSRNFALAQVFVWLGILASFGSTIAAATDKVENWLTAMLAAIPGVVILIDRSFGFDQRAKWCSLYRIELDHIADRVKFDSAIKPQEVADQIRALALRMEHSFPETRPPETPRDRE